MDETDLRRKPGQGGGGSAPRRLLNGFVLTAVVASALLVSLLLYRFVYMGVPLYDEWHCSKGEAPVEFDGGDGGRACFPEGAALPAGAAWDPLGNRPFTCHKRRGCTEIHSG